MSNIFGSISHQDFLPPGYGDIETKVVQRVGVEDPSAGDAPSMEPMDDYAGLKDWGGGIKDWKIFGGEGRSSSDTGTTGTTSTVSAAPEVQAAPPPYRTATTSRGTTTASTPTARSRSALADSPLLLRKAPESEASTRQP